MEVFAANEQDIPVDEAMLSSLARHVLDAEDVDEEAELSLLFVSAGHIRRLNARYAEHDYPTDVLAFPMMEDDETSILLGDVVVCPEVARDNATKYGHPLAKELATLVVHGTLHLLGYDHQSTFDGTKMEQRQNELLGSFRLPGA